MKRLETDGGVILWIFFTCVMSKVVMLSHVRGWSRRKENFFEANKQGCMYSVNNVICSTETSPAAKSVEKRIFHRLRDLCSFVEEMVKTRSLWL